MDRRVTDSAARAELIRTVRQARRRWRIRVALRGAVLVLGALLAGFIVASVALERLEFSPVAILVARGALALAGVGLAAWLLALPLLRRVSDERVALYIEEHEPSLQAALVSALDGSAGTGGPSAALLNRIVADAVARCREIEYGRRIERANLKRSAAVGGGVAVAGVALFLISPAFVTHSARALFLPAPTAPPTPTPRVEVSPGDASVPRGSDQTVVARVSGLDAQRVELVVRGPEDSTFQRIPMLAARAGGEYQLSLFDVAGPTEYFVEADGVRSRTYRLSVLELPYVGRLDLELVYPAYTGLAPRTVEDGGDVAALVGTRVRLRAHPTTAVPEGRIVLDDGRTLALTADSAATLHGEFQVRRTGYYHLELRSGGGEWLTASPQFLIDALEDAPPTVSFEKPGRDVNVTSVDEVFVEARAEDDFGVATLELVYSINGQPERTVPLYQARPLREVIAGHTLYLEEMELQAGDFISYYARAADGGPGRQRPVVSDIYFMEIRPFGREYRQAETRGGMGGGGGEGPDGELSQRQREIIAATFNLVRDRTRYTDKEFAEHLTTLALAQERLREQVETLTQRMLNRGIVGDSSFQKIAELLPRAADEMRDAAGRLRARAPDDALPPEQRALQQLQRAEAVYRDVQVGAGGSQGAAGGAPNAEDLADLFGLELDKLRNQYEVVQRGEREQMQRQLDQTLERLRDLARRQEQENERLRRELSERQQRAGGGGESQRRLAEETEEAARQLERLAREQSRADLMQAARRLRETADAMRRSAGSGRGGLAEAGSALEGLRETQRRLQRQRSAGLQQEVQDAQQRAERLREEQREIASEMEQLGRGGADRARRARELGDRKEEQAQELGALRRQLDRLASDARDESREAARELQEAARSIRENRLEEKIRQSRLGTQPNASPEYVRRMEEQIAAGLDELRRGLEQAGEAAGRSADRSGETGLERARDLARSLESLQERMRAAQENRGRQGAEGSESPQADPQPGGEAEGQAQGQSRSGRRGGEGESTGPRRGETSGGIMSPGSGWGGIANLAPDEVRQLRREARERLEEARELRDRLAREGHDVRELNQLIEDLRRLDDQRVYADWEELAHLQAALVDRAKRFEFDLRRAVEGADRERVFLSGSAGVPEGYRALVEEYYRSLAEQGRRR